MVVQNFAGRPVTGTQVNSTSAARGPAPKKKIVDVTDAERNRNRRASELMMKDHLSSAAAISIAWQEFPDPDPDRN